MIRVRQHTATALQTLTLPCQCQAGHRPRNTGEGWLCVQQPREGHGTPSELELCPCVCSKAELTTGPISLLLPPQRIRSINHPGSQARHWLPPSCSPPNPAQATSRTFAAYLSCNPVPYPAQSRQPLPLWVAAKSLSPISLVCTPLTHTHMHVPRELSRESFQNSSLTRSAPLPSPTWPWRLGGFFHSSH